MERDNKLEHETGADPLSVAQPDSLSFCLLAWGVVNNVDSDPAS